MGSVVVCGTEVSYSEEYDLCLEMARVAYVINLKRDFGAFGRRKEVERPSSMSPRRVRE